MNTFIYKKLPYDPVRDFVPITQTVANPMGAVVNPASGIKSIKDIVERAKANPGQLNYGSFGIGNMTHLMGVMLSIAADIQMTQSIIEVAKPLGISVHDHIIVGKEGHASFKGLKLI